jgi:hypothetical protein
LERFRWVVASVTAALWLLTGFLAVSQELHGCLHHEAGTPQHECLITKYSDGQFLNAPAPIALPVAAGDLAVAAVHVKEAVLSSDDFRLPPGRGPPLS